MSDLTDRYVWAVVRLLPDDQRAEIDQELHELIAEMTDARAAAAADDDPEVIGREVLVELGDPGRLAAQYVERPRALVGHEVFPEYMRILKLVLAIAVPAVAALTLIGTGLDADRTTWDVIGAVIGAVFQTAIQVAFWVTLVYAFADRWKADSPWTPDDLPALPASATGPGFDMAETVFGIVLTVLVAIAIVWQQVWPPLDDADGDGVPFLDPDMWNGFGQALLVVLGASLIVQLVVLVRRRWTYQLAAANAIVNAASIAIVAWLAFDDRFVNQDFLDVLVERTDVEGPWLTLNPWLPVVIIAALEVWDTVEAFANARRTAHNRDRLDTGAAPAEMAQ